MSRLLFVFLVVFLIILAFFTALLVLGPVLDGCFIPGTWLWEVPVGGRKPAETLTDVIQGLGLDAPRIILVGPDEQRWAFSPLDLGISLQVEETLARAYTPGHTGPDLEMPLTRLSLMRKGQTVSPVLVWERARAEAQLQSLADQIDLPAKDARVLVEGGELRLESSAVGLRLNITETLSLVEPLLRSPEVTEIPLVIEHLEPQITDAEAAQALSIAHTILSEPLQILLADPQEGDPGPWTLKPDLLAEMLVIYTEEGHVGVQIDEAALAGYLEPIAKALAREPLNAQFRFEGGELVPVERSRAGRALNVDASIARIQERLGVGQHLVPLVVEEVEPAYSETATAADLGIIEEIAVGESYFVGSSSARDHNIRLGASKFDGIIVGPGETFSFNEFLGEVTLDEGYDESYVIIGDRTVPGVGGGICQVATTVFRAAYYAGYPIIERWPHAYRVGYYELGGFGPGFDATIYSPLVDFRFTNDTPYHLLIHTEVDSARSRLRFVFYSTDDGRTVEQIGPEWGEPEPAGPPVYQFDEEMAAGTVEKLESAHDGLRAVLERVVRDVEGTVLYEDRFESHFVPWPARYRYGPGFVPPEGAEIVGEEP